MKMQKLEIKKDKDRIAIVYEANEVKQTELDSLFKILYTGEFSEAKE